MAALTTDQKNLVDALGNAVMILLNIEMRETGNAGSHLTAAEISGIQAAQAAITTAHAQVLAGS